MQPPSTKSTFPNHVLWYCWHVQFLLSLKVDLECLVNCYVYSICNVTSAFTGVPSPTASTTSECTLLRQVLTYTAGHINYGGRVTDDWDRRCMMNILSDFYHFNVLKPDHTYSESGIYKQIDTDLDNNVSVVGFLLTYQYNVRSGTDWTCVGCWKELHTSIGNHLPAYKTLWLWHLIDVAYDSKTKGMDTSLYFLSLMWW